MLLLEEVLDLGLADVELDWLAVVSVGFGVLDQVLLHRVVLVLFRVVVGAEYLIERVVLWLVDRVGCGKLGSRSPNRVVLLIEEVELMLGQRVLYIFGCTLHKPLVQELVILYLIL